LTDEGYYVVKVPSSEGAKYWAINKELRHLDMIISDQRMPGELGTSFLDFLCELAKVDLDKLDRNSKLYLDTRKRFSDLNDNEFEDYLKLMQINPCLRVILSGYDEDDNIRKALSSGTIHKYISKKTPMTEILGIVNAMLEK
jgi:DNA-binding NarL/FixJ family response regulator